MWVTPAQVVVHQCPGCRSWQVDYSDDIAEQWPIYRWDGPGLTVDLRPFQEDVDEAVREHTLTCPAAATEFLTTQVGQPMI